MNTRHDRDPGLNLLDRFAVWLLGPILLPFLLVARQREIERSKERARKRREEETKR
jgi:hypothetical protein